MKMKRPITLLVLVMAVLIVFVSLAVRRANQAEADKARTENRAEAMKRAVVDFQSLRFRELDGVAAEVTVKDIRRELTGAGLSVSSIGTTYDELAQYVCRAYEGDARLDLSRLGELKADPNTAEKLRTWFLEAREKSCKPLTAFVANINVVNEFVARNYIGAGKAQGAAVSPGSLRQQGVRVGTYTKPSPKHKAPAKKAAPMRSRPRLRAHR